MTKNYLSTKKRNSIVAKSLLCATVVGMGVGFNPQTVKSDNGIEIVAGNVANAAVLGDANRITYGSNLWVQSNLREWLNSNKQVVEYSNQKPDMRNDGYDTEAGFLTIFTQAEQDAIKITKHKSYLASCDKVLAEGADSIGSYMMVNDKVFNLTKDELTKYVKNRGWSIIGQTGPSLNASIGSNHNYWLNNPEPSYSSIESMVDSSGVFGGNYANDTYVGVRPALHLESEIFKSETGTTTNLKLGDIVTLGKYRGYDIQWKVINIDGDGPLLFAEKILCRKAFDAKGDNNDSDKKSTVDYTKPADIIAPTLNITPNTISWTNKDITLNITSTDNESGIKNITLPGGSVITGNTASFTISANGKYTFIAEDNAGNKKTMEYEVTNIDKVAPNKPTINVDGNQLSIIDGTDTGSGIKETSYQFNNGAWTKYAGPVTLNDGEYTINSKTIDNAGNESLVSSKTDSISVTAVTNATNAVVTAETSKLQNDVDNARILVNALPNSTEKTDLTNRLDKVQKDIDETIALNNAIANATKSVVKAEGSKLQNDVDNARILVNALPNGSVKTDLTARLDKVQKAIDNTIPTNNTIAAATALAEKAEKSLLREDYNIALASVNVLPNIPGKSNLVNRLINLNAKLSAKDAEIKMNNYNNIKTADRLVRIASISKNANDIAKAQDAIDILLDDANKTNLQNWLDSIVVGINNKSPLQLQRDAETAIKKAETSKTKELIAAAQVAIDLIPNTVSTKANYQARLNAIFVGGIGSPVDLITQMRNAEKSLKQVNIDNTVNSLAIAETLINALPQSDKKESMLMSLEAEKLMQKSETEATAETLAAAKAQIEKLNYDMVKYNLLKRVAKVQKLIPIV